MENGLPFKILMADDDQDDREFIDDAFIQIGYAAEVKKFIDGKSLLGYLQQMEVSLLPSLIVLDSSLPGLDVESLLLFLKKEERYKNIPVVIYSGSLSSAMRQKLLQQGAYAIIEKVANMKNVVEIAQRLKDIATTHMNPVA
jgi:CheY-like chemotaxis protein